MILLHDNEYKNFGTKLGSYTENECKTRRKVIETKLKRECNLSIFDPEYELLIDYLEDSS